MEYLEILEALAKQAPNHHIARCYQMTKNASCRNRQTQFATQTSLCDHNVVLIEIHQEATALREHTHNESNATHALLCTFQNPNPL